MRNIYQDICNQNHVIFQYLIESSHVFNIERPKELYNIPGHSRDPRLSLVIILPLQG